MNKTNLLIVTILSLLLSGCLKIPGVMKKNTSENTDIENVKIENLASIYSNMEGTYLDRINVTSICQSFKGKISINNETGKKEYTKKTIDILNNINSALECKVTIPITIVDHESYAAITRNDGVYLTRGVFENSDYIDEIAFIITHESIHYLLEHPKKMTLKESSLEAEEMRTTKAMNDEKSKSFLTGIFSSSRNIVTDNYSRVMKIEKTRAKNGLTSEHETQADLLGIDLLVKAHYSPQALPYNLEIFRSCLDYQEGDFESAFNSLNKQADKINNGNHKSYSDYLDFLDGMNNLTGDHSPIPWREQMIFTYIKVKYPNKLRNEMIENI